jgi:hypothetical protein
MPENDDKLGERAAELDERAEKLDEREAKIAEREAKLGEREEQLNTMSGGWPFPSSMLPMGAGGIFVAAYITPVTAMPKATTATVSDPRFDELEAKWRAKRDAKAAGKAATPEPVPAPRVYKTPTGT